MPALIWVGVIVILCGFPGNRIPDFDLLNKLSFDKVVHACMFMILVLTLMYPVQDFLPDKWLQASILEFAFIFGILMETMQTNIFINRFGEWVDMLANATGAVLGLFIGKYILKKRRHT